MGDPKGQSEEMQEFRRKVIEAKIRLVLGLKPEEDIREAMNISIRKRSYYPQESRKGDLD